MAISINWFDAIVSIVGLAVAIGAFGLAYWHPRKKELIEQLCDDDNRPEIYRDLQQHGIRKAYQDRLDGLNAWADGVFGSPRRQLPSFRAHLTWKSHDRCLLIAFIYPLFLFLAAWLFGASATFGDLEFLPAELTPLQRLGVALTILLGASLTFWVFRNLDRIQQLISSVLKRVLRMDD